MGRKKKSENYPRFEEVKPKPALKLGKPAKKPVLPKKSPPPKQPVQPTKPKFGY